MSWRDRAEPKQDREKGDKPSLEDLLDLYDVTYTHRTSQMVRCPQHEDGTPSCSVNLDKQLWNCHSCGTGGDAWELIKRMENTDFDGARTFATAKQLTTGGPGGGGQQLRDQPGDGPRWGRMAGGSGSHGGNGGYVPAWRRR